MESFRRSLGRAPLATQTALVLHAPSGAWAVRRGRAARAALVTDKSCSGIDYNTSTTVGAPKERDSIAIPK